MNIFIEKKTNIGFYNLKDPMGLTIFLKNSSFFSSFLLLRMLKLKIKIHNYMGLDFFIN
jgi:hypothetical protein